ncbi:ferrous iron transport protein B [Herbaspirillum sp. Sphag1AN]|uniref:ferrous iron transport protein B n=1 Tax=unclassified Herbaspirillum TaxID=2624150 RepID=UPI001622B0B5|nr:MULTISPECIES: ferrous iron transport protein B [unclassified Herbaspirillum]MBB3214365.1 ferrous iron transport protein B [Herbaspirillum sp. Sphag1AN]MBB3247417.1 ferrous iron transport protein B [Herbaspirillum sp. Sphag64]
MQQANTLNLALVGNPNCGKTALFNRLTGARQKVANYAGVTVERKAGRFASEQGFQYQVLDLPGTYSLSALTPDEAITRAVLMGERRDEVPPDLIVLVVDASKLQLNLKLVVEVLRLNRPTVLALNMIDIARKRGIEVDAEKLSRELGIPVVETVAVKKHGVAALVKAIDEWRSAGGEHASWTTDRFNQSESMTGSQRQDIVRHILNVAVTERPLTNTTEDKIDAWVLHPVLGYVILLGLLFMIFQAVFSWSEMPMDFIKDSMDGLGALVAHLLPDGLLRSLLVDGIIAGVGSVLVFLPQILILFFFILLLEDSGYLPRAAFLLDRLMGSVGLSGRAFIPLLSSFACAIPGVMATRTIQNPRDRLATIMIAPLMTCSARLPVYALIIAAFIPNRDVGIFNLQGLVLFGLYLLGIIAAMAVAYVFKRLITKDQPQPLMLELPNYHLPNWRNLALGLWERGRIFVSRVGTIILALMIILWFLSTFPGAPAGATGPAIEYSLAGKIGAALQPLFAPIGFTWEIVIALIPGMAAREVAVGALGTVYALSATGDEVSSALGPMLPHLWTLPTALSLLMWYVFAPQCISTLSIVKRETNSWTPALVMAGYMFALAYLASFVTYQLAVAFL